MKRNIKLPIYFSFLITLFGVFLILQDARAGGRCTCTQYVEYSDCGNCGNICTSMFVRSVPLGRGEPACTTERPGVAICTCITQRSLLTESLDECANVCRTQISDPSDGTKRGTGIGEFQAVPGEGEACDHDAECTGEGCPVALTTGRSECYCSFGIEDYSSEAEYRASGSRGTCVMKGAPNDPCFRNEHCLSNICTDGRCANGGLSTPETEEKEEIFPTYEIKPPIGEVTGPQLIGRIIKTILALVGAFALAMFVYGGFTWLTSGGSPDRIKKGKDILIWAVIGLIVILASYTLVDFVLKAFGL